MKKIVSVIVFLGLNGCLFAQNPLVQQLSAQVNQDSLITYVKQLSGLLPIETPQGSKVIGSRYKINEGNELAAEFIKQKLTSWGITYTELNFSTTGQNIIGKIEGRRPGKIMVAGAHYDAVNGSPGADDNASGTAAILEMARVCAGQQLPVTLHFAFWDEEEQGLIGSHASATDYMQFKLVGYINLDMLAYDSDNDSSFDIHSRPAGSSVEMGQRAYDLIALYDVPLRPRLINPGDPNTDHGSFWQNNLSAIGINEEYEGDFTPHWHKYTDSITYFNVSYYTRVSRFATTAFLHFAMDSNNLVALNEYGLSNDLVDVYPNPFTTHIKISNAEQVNLVKAELVDVSGQLIHSSFIELNAVDLPATLSNGVYYLLLHDKNGFVFRKKLIKS